MAHAPGYEDWRIREARGVYQTSVGGWTGWPTEDVRALWEIVGPIASRLGYDAPAGPPRPSETREDATLDGGVDDADVGGAARPMIGPDVPGAG